MKTCLFSLESQTGHSICETTTQTWCHLGHTCEYDGAKNTAVFTPRQDEIVSAKGVRPIWLFSPRKEAFVHNV